MEITLSNGMVCHIDDDDYHLVKGKKWRAYKSRNTYYAVSSDGVRMHRLILAAQKGEVVDHKDWNGLNNRRDNIRITDHAGNVVNYKGRSKYGYKGVCYDARCKTRPFQAICKKNNKNISGGFYATPEEAGKAYDRIAAKVHGPTAYLNFPEALEANSND